MGKIPKNLVEVGYNDATVMMDVDALTRESMIKMFDLKDKNGNPMDSYDDAYFESGLPTSDEPGMASLIEQFILLETKILGFLFQQFLYMVKPIQIALELPQLLLDPKKLAEKIKEIIESIKKLIEDVIEFFTDTKNWFIDKIVGDFLDINIPIPEIILSLIGIEITIPAIDNLNLFGKAPYLENLDGTGIANMAEKMKEAQQKLQDYIDGKIDKAKSNINENFDGSGIDKIKTKLADTRKKLQSLKDSSNININTMQYAILGTLITSLGLLTSVLWEETDDFYDVAYKIHLEVMKKQKLVKVKLKKMDKKNTMVNSTKVIIGIKEELNNYTENEYKIKTYLDKDRLKEIPDELIEIIDDEEETTTDVINKYKLKKDQTFKKKIDAIDKKIYELYLQLSPLRFTIDNTKEEMTEKEKAIALMKDNMRDFISVGAAAAITLLEDEIKSLINMIADISPASAWKEKTLDIIIDIIRSPIDLIVGLISKLFEGILQFLEELPLPSFEKIKEFFTDILSLPNLEKMGEFIADILNIPPELSATLENIMKFLPWLFVTTAGTFVTSLANPLPIPI